MSLVRRVFRRGSTMLMDAVINTTAWAAAPVVARMARTGRGTDSCLRYGCLPLSVHFYSPVPDVADLEHRNVWGRRSNLVGIDFSPEKQISLLKELGETFGEECQWSPNAIGDPLSYYTENGNFSYGCAASTHCVIRQFKPQRVVEIGSGNSSLVISAALSKNMREGHKADYTIIDPYPGPTVDKGILKVSRLIKERVELVEVECFEQLEAHDVLFIDSGHTVRIGGDVNYLFLDVLPRLRSGVIVHIHDINLPYEYPKVYATNPRFRMFWTEAYLLQAFLCFNSAFEILLAMAYLMTDRKKDFMEVFPTMIPRDTSQSAAVFGYGENER